MVKRRTRIKPGLRRKPKAPKNQKNRYLSDKGKIKLNCLLPKCPNLKEVWDEKLSLNELVQFK
jgi:hypothetical protein